MRPRIGKPRSYWGGYILAFLILVMDLLRIRQNFGESPKLEPALAGLAIYASLLLFEFLLSSVIRWPWALYFAAQVCMLVFLAGLPPFLDVIASTYLPLFIQAYYYLPRRRAAPWALVFSLALTASLVAGLGLREGLGQGLQIVAEAFILTMLMVLVVQSHEDREESQVLVTNLEAAQRKLQEYTAQAEQLVEERERNRLRRELHDSVGQMIFSIELTCESARLLLERDSAQVPALLERMQDMSTAALGRLRSIISELRPQA
jgi:signal transduction histidine kinase